MDKNSTYKEKFSILKSWMPHIIDMIKKDLKHDHLKNDPLFCKKHFYGKNPAKLTIEELVDGYQQAFAEGEHSEAIGEFMANRWLLKNGDIYNYFAGSLSKINPNFSEIEELSKEDSHAILNEGKAQFDVQDLYLFSVMNAVAFPDNIYAELAKQALTSSENAKNAAETAEIEKSVENLTRAHQTQLARMVDKYEKKLVGLEKKYHHDVDSLKKQVSRLQKQLTGSPKGA